MKIANEHNDDNFLSLSLFVLQTRIKNANFLANVIEILCFAQLR